MGNIKTALKIHLACVGFFLYGLFESLETDIYLGISVNLSLLFSMVVW